MYRSFNTHGARGAVPIPDEIHNKIGRILQQWLAEEGDIIEPGTMTLYVTGECETQKTGEGDGTP